MQRWRKYARPVRIAILVSDIVHNSIDDRKRPLSGRTVVKVYDLMTVDLGFQYREIFSD